MCQALLWHQPFRINRAPALAAHDLAQLVGEQRIQDGALVLCGQGGMAEPQGMWCSGRPKSTRPHQRDLEIKMGSEG